MSNLPVPENEVGRLNALKNYKILNSLSEEEYDRITTLASIICQVPISLITLLDEDRQWFKSKVGMNIDQTPRELAFCQYTIMDRELFEINDALEDERFKYNPLVQNEPNIRFYAGYPLTDPNGYALGTLCVVDNKPNQLTDDQKAALRLLSLEVMQLILERRQKEELKNFEKLFVFSNDLICIVGLDGFFKKVNPAFEKLLGWDIEIMLQKNIFELIHPDDENITAEKIEKLKRGDDTSNFEHRLLTASGEYKTFQWVATHEIGTDNLFAIGRDITIAKANEKRLAASEASSRAVFENSQGLICTHDLAGNFISVNQSGAHMLGYSRAEITKMSLFDVIPEQRHTYLKDYLEHIRNNGSGSGQMQVKHKNGELKTLLFNNILEQTSNEVPYIIGNALDVTERQLLENKLQQITEMLEQTNQVARVGGWQFNLIKEQLYWTSVTKEIHEAPIDYEPEMTTALSFYQEGESRSLITAAVEMGIKEGKSWELELQIITMKGNIRWVKVNGSAVFENGVCKRLYGSFQDIDERKRTEIELKRSRRLLSSFAIHTPAAVAMLDNEMNYIAVSNRWLEDYGLMGKDIIGTSYYDHFSFITDERKERHKRILRGGVERNDEDIYLGAEDGEKRFVAWEMRPWLESIDKIGGMMMFTQNITAMVIQREELKNAKSAAEQANVAKSEFLSNMSHEIRTPLNGVIGFTDLVLKTSLNDTQQQYLSIVNQSANALLGIINDILDFSKIEAGKLELDIEECDLYEICGDATDIIAFQVQKKGLEMLLNLAPDLPRFVWTDSVRLKQILVNLLGNAAKFTDDGEIELKILVLEEHNTESLIRFSVMDTGIGIKKDKQNKIFEAFAQEDGSTTKKYGGTGLGLAITNKLLGMMDSKLQLYSTVGEGSVFFFDILLQSKKGEPKQWENISWIKNVLIVDDNDNNRAILEQMLLLKDITSQHARNGYEALQMLNQEVNYDVILMDYHMPYLDGLDTIRQLRAKLNKSGKRQTIVLLHSSSDDETVINASNELQVSARLVKPVKMTDLYNTLSRILLKEQTTLVSADAPSMEITEEAIMIMVADDNPVNMLLAKTIITRAAGNAIVIEAKNGLEVLHHYEKLVPDLILMDVQMPEMNGYEATIAIRKLEKDIHTPIIALTAGNVKNEREKCKEAGMDDFVVKPVIEETIRQILKKWLNITVIHEIGDIEQSDHEMKHYDSSVLKDHIGDDVVVLAEILVLAKEQLNKSLTVLKAAIDQQNILAISAEGHKINGTAVSAGLPFLAKLARAVEMEDAPTVEHTKTIFEEIKKEINLCIGLMESALA